VQLIAHSGLAAVGAARSASSRIVKKGAGK